MASECAPSRITGAYARVQCSATGIDVALADGSGGTASGTSNAVHDPYILDPDYATVGYLDASRSRRTESTV